MSPEFIPRLKSALEKTVSGNGNPFQTYKEFAKDHGFSTRFCPSWANRFVLDDVADALKKDPKIGIDLTFLIRSGKTGYPSVIDRQPFDPNDERQKARAREVAAEIIKKYGLNAKNPY